MKFCGSLMFVALVFCATVCQAQVSENFADGNFIINPAWVEDVDSFQVNNGELQSLGPQASSVIHIATANTRIDSAEWNFYLRLDFNPSTTNFVKLYLVSNQVNLEGALNGYFVQFGETGTTDSLDVFRQDGTLATKVFTAANECMTSSISNAVRIRITRIAGMWQVFTDCTGGTNFALQGTFTDNTYTSTNWFGMVCDYNTASRFDKYFLDDISIASLTSDTAKPTVQSVIVLSATQLDVQFSEAVELISAQQLSNYNVDGGIGQPIIALRDASDFSLVHLTLANALANGTNYHISIVGVKDASSNTMLPASIPFSFFTAAQHNVIINEIMADPDPAVGLPAAEFVELHNTTPFAIDVSGWQLSDPSTTSILPTATIPPDSFLILVKQDSAATFAIYGSVSALIAFPSLNNTGDQITLRNANGALIDRVDYIDDWYQDNMKSDGGWSLELINPQNACAQNGNWLASNDVSGGTPGRRNSVFNVTTSQDLTLSAVNVIASDTIIVTFNQILDATSAAQSSNYNIAPSIVVNAAIFDTLTNNSVMLALASALDSGTVYTLIVSALQNCLGATISSGNQKQFAIPTTALRYDVVIDEVMADPEPVVGLPNAEYVELRNRSAKTFSLKNWTLTKPGSNGAILPDVLLLPDSFLVFCEASAVSAFAQFNNVIGVSNFPSVTNSGDALLLKDDNADILHSIAFEDSWYGDALKQNGGWSLEMIDAGNPCNGADNWRASTDASGGTLARKNSVDALNPDTISPRLFRAALEDANTLILYFSEALDQFNASAQQNYFVNQSVGAPALAIAIPFDYKTIQLEFVQNFQSGIVYAIHVSNLSDCSGNSIGMFDTARFAIAVPMDSILPHDVSINEILFNPRTDGVDFVELYNRSSKIINLKDLAITEQDLSDPNTTTEFGNASNENYLLFPNEYAVVTEDAQNIRTNYFCENEFALIETSLPNFDDNESVAMLKTQSARSIDSLHYSHDWHYPLLDDEDGVSLERTTFDGETSDRDLWHSAASSVGFATPSFLNSQFAQDGISEDEVWMDPDIFTPNNDGEKDFTFVHYRFAQPGYNCTVRIFDIKGREVKVLVRSEMLAAEGFFQWDGTDDANRKARSGVYIVYAEVFDLVGKVKRCKRAVVLGVKLE